MQLLPNKRTLTAIAAGLFGHFTASFAAVDSMPAPQQNLLVQKYCAVCHTDSARNGGLSLQHFDAARLDPSLAAMLVSKLKTGAFGAAGVPLPDKPTMAALTDALTTEAAGAQEWTVVQQPFLMASILRELRSARVGTEPALYRLVASCNATTYQGNVQLSWSPAPKTGLLSASFDGKEPVWYTVEGIEKMGNGTALTTGPAAFDFPLFGKKAGLPLHTLAVGGLFPDESVVFPFDTLPRPTRDAFSACFPAPSPDR